MKYWLLRHRTPPAVIIRPREWAYGHQLQEILMGLYMALRIGGTLTIVPPWHVANRALLQLECAEVPIRRRGLAAASVQLHGRWLDWSESASAALRQLVLRIQLLGVAILGQERAREERVHAFVKRARERAKAGPRRDYLDVDFRREFGRRPLGMRLNDAVERRARAQAARAGIDTARLAIVHARESGYKRGIDSTTDQRRNARIDSYASAVDLLQASGFTVVRIGDASMTPFTHPGVMDLATSPHRTDELELWCVLQSRLFIASDSGPFVGAYAANVPMLMVNVTSVIDAYPLRRGDRYILKHVHDATTGRILTVDEVATPALLAIRKDVARYTFVDNTADEIREAVAEMLRIDRKNDVLDDAQQEFRRMIADVWNSAPLREKRARSGQVAEQFLGDGAIGSAFANSMFGRTANAAQA